MFLSKKLKPLLKTSFVNKKYQVDFSKFYIGLLFLCSCALLLWNKSINFNAKIQTLFVFRSYLKMAGHHSRQTLIKTYNQVVFAGGFKKISNNVHKNLKKCPETDNFRT